MAQLMGGPFDGGKLSLKSNSIVIRYQNPAAKVKEILFATYLRLTEGADWEFTGGLTEYESRPGDVLLEGEQEVVSLKFCGERVKFTAMFCDGMLN